MKTAFLLLSAVHPYLVIGVVAVGVFVAFWYLLYEHLQAKTKARIKQLEQCRAERIKLVNMYTEAKWMCRVIGSADTYQKYCETEDRLDRFAKEYREMEGFADVIYGLADLLEKKRVIVRRSERVRPMDVRYTPE